MDLLAKFTWVAFPIAAYFLWQAKKGNAFIILGMLGLGVPGFLHFLTQYEFLDRDFFRELGEAFTLMRLAAIGAITIGIFKLARGPAELTRTLDAQGDDLSTLFTPRNDSNTFSTAQRLRDDALARLVARADEANITVVKQSSQAHSPTVWLRLDYMLPPPGLGLSLPAHVGVDIERYDFHRFEHTFSVQIQTGQRINKRTRVIALDEAAIDAIHQYIVTPGTRLRLPNRVREWPWQLWRPRNKVSRLRKDWETNGLVALAVVLLQIPPPFGVFLAALVGVAIYMRSFLRRTHVLTTGKPTRDPRSLRWMDSWQSSIGGLGTVADTVKEGIIGRLHRLGLDAANVDVEKIGYWGTDQWVEREQIVITHRRAMGFIQVMPYYDVLYLAWECHLNSATWIEQTLSRGVDRSSGLDVVANRVVAGWQQLNEYDVGDSNLLAEWLHEAVKSEAKLRMAEHKIDQEIDFTVQRESRKVNSATPDQGKTTEKMRSGLRRLT